MKNIAVTGANGQLGKALQKLAVKYPEFNFLFTDIDTLDIGNKEAVLSYLKSHYISTIINAAAFTAVEKAEEEEEKAYHINAIAVRNLAEAAYETRAKLIHISTDYVFDGTHHLPYVETDATHPVSAYGRTKLAGEIMIQETGTDAIIIRTSWLYSEEGNNFLKTMMRLGKEQTELRVVFDQIGTPTYAGDLAGAILAILKRAEKGDFHVGIYHYSSEGVCSWYDFACKIMELADLSCHVFPVTSKEYPTRAIRPSYSVLNKSKIKNTYGINILHWEESLKSLFSSSVFNL